MSKIPTLKLNTGAEIPQLGFGTFAIKPPDAAAAVHTALTTGYRLIDTAKNYANEKEVGEGIARAGLPRGDLFVTTKLWIEDFGYDNAMRAFDASLSKLGLDYLDLYLLHWPVPMDFEPTVAAYKAVEKIKADGRARAIGVSNFKPDHLRNLLDRTSVVPAVNQIELNPLFNQAALREANARHGIVTESWSPIGGGKNVMHLLTNRQVGAIATKHGKTPVQVVLRWHLQHGLVAIPRSTNPKHIAENFDVFGFELAPADMAALDGLETGERGGPDPDTFDLAAFKELVAQRDKK
ncbi:MAG TPA: aldo/keto reductase [Methylobacterium sp.]|nr:aldo/keto reductase [Methylobacterium sp.]